VGLQRRWYRGVKSSCAVRSFDTPVLEAGVCASSHLLPRGFTPRNPNRRRATRGTAQSTKGEGRHGDSRKHGCGAKVRAKSCRMTDFLQTVKERVVVYDGAMGTNIQFRNLPRQREGRRLCVSDFFAPKSSGKMDVIGLFSGYDRARRRSKLNTCSRVVSIPAIYTSMDSAWRRQRLWPSCIIKKCVRNWGLLTKIRRRFAICFIRSIGLSEPGEPDQAVCSA